MLAILLPYCNQSRLGLQRESSVEVILPGRQEPEIKKTFRHPTPPPG